MFLAVLLALQMPVPIDAAPIDWGLTHTAEAIARQGGLTKSVVVRTPGQWREKGIVNATTLVDGNLIVIQVSPILVDEMDAEGLRGMLAHELAHTLDPCGRTASRNGYPSEEAELACEGKADARSARWVGRRAAVRGLCQLMAIGWDWRAITDVSGIIARIKLLHGRRDIPFVPETERLTK